MEVQALPVIEFYPMHGVVVKVKPLQLQGQQVRKLGELEALYKKYMYLSLSCPTSELFYHWSGFTLLWTNELLVKHLICANCYC